METNLQTLLVQPAELAETISFYSFYGAAYNNSETYFAVNRWFVLQYGVIPCVMHMEQMKVPQAMAWVEATFAAELTQDFHFKRWEAGEQAPQTIQRIRVFRDGIVVAFLPECQSLCLWYTAAQQHRLEALVKGLRQYGYGLPLGKQKWIYLMANIDKIGPQVEKKELPEVQMDLATHYPPKLRSMHERLLDWLNHSPEQGLVLLYGPAGTGKKTYAQYLMPLLERKVVVVNSFLTPQLAQTEVIEQWSEYPNAVIVVEQAEQVLRQQEGDPHPAVSVLQMLCKGLLGACNRWKVVCLFEGALTDIDVTLLRLPQLHTLYGFEPLEAVQAQALAQQLGFSVAFDRPKTLAEIYALRANGPKTNDAPKA